MELWQLILYGLAALWALRSLFSLMTGYRDQLRHEFETRETNRLREEQAHERAERKAEAARSKRAKGAA
jgi:hypothetical protein